MWLFPTILIQNTLQHHLVLLCSSHSQPNCIKTMYVCGRKGCEGKKIGLHLFICIGEHQLNQWAPTHYPLSNTVQYKHIPLLRHLIFSITIWKHMDKFSIISRIYQFSGLWMEQYLKKIWCQAVSKRHNFFANLTFNSRFWTYMEIHSWCKLKFQS